MSFISPMKRDISLYRELCLAKAENFRQEQEIKSAIGTIVIECSNFFTVDVQPIYIDEGFAFVITQYGSEEVIIVRDNDYPDLELPEWCSSELTPLGFRKAAALSGILHAENIKKYGISGNFDESYYYPQLPYIAYLKSIGKTVPFNDRVLIWYRKFTESKFYHIASGILVNSLIFAAVGAVLALINHADLRLYIWCGALIGTGIYVVHYLISLLEDKEED